MSQLANEGGNCPVGWQGTESKCYRVSDDRMSYDKAQEFCDGLYGALATIENKNEAVLVEWAYFVSRAKGLVFIRCLINMICLLISLRSIQDVVSAQARERSLYFIIHPFLQYTHTKKGLKNLYRFLICQY